jgi:hypothetical protein
MLLSAERHQAAVISILVMIGRHDIAARIARCQQERQHRQPAQYPWRCGSAGCWQCRRTAMYRWWRRFRVWRGDVQDTSLAVLTINGDLIAGTRRLRKGMRDIRDRMTRDDPRWASVAMAGLVGDRVAVTLVKHPGLARADVWWALAGRWPDIVLTEIDNATPSNAMLADDAVSLALCRRGIEPVRIIVLEQVTASHDPWGEPMPMVF